VCVVLPAAAAAAAGVRVPAAAAVLAAEMLWSSGAMIWAQLAGLWRHRQRPDELAVKARPAWRMSPSHLAPDCGHRAPTRFWTGTLSLILVQYSEGNRLRTVRAGCGARAG
jgi:hypothetical protein